MHGYGVHTVYIYLLHAAVTHRSFDFHNSSEPAKQATSTGAYGTWSTHSTAQYSANSIASSWLRCRVGRRTVQSKTSPELKRAIIYRM
jgi:hypothetical protein